MLVPLPAAAGRTDSIVIGRIVPVEPGTRYVIGLKAYDKVGNPSEVSNIVSFTTPGQAVTITDTIDVGDLELWVSGRRISGPSVVCMYDGYNILIGDVRVPTDPHHPEWTDDAMQRIYGETPFVKNLVRDGVSYREAGLRFSREISIVMEEARRIREKEGILAGDRFLLASVLVERVEGGIIYFTGLRTGIGWAVSGAEPAPNPVPGITITVSAANYDRAESLFNNIRSRGWTGHQILVVTRGAIMSWGGKKTRAQFDAQIQHLYGGGSIATMPHGPLTDRMAAEIVRKMP
jgi:hypothetical protein